MILAGLLIWQSLQTRTLRNQSTVIACDEFALTHPAAWNVSVHGFYDEQNKHSFAQCLLTNLALGDLPSQGGLYYAEDDVVGTNIRISVEYWPQNKTLEKYLETRYPFSYAGPNSNKKTAIASKELFHFDNNTDGIIVYLDSDRGSHDPFDPKLRPTVYHKIGEFLVVLDIDATNETQKQQALDIVKTLHQPFR